jgi:hypothetical protein
MAKFSAFKDWKAGKQISVVKEDSQEKDSTDKKEVAAPGNSELLALIEDLSVKRNEASRANDGLGRQMYDLDIRIAKLEMQKNELVAKRKELEGAKAISETRKRIPRANHE